MKFLVSQITDLKIRLLRQIVLPQGSISAVPNRRTESNPMDVCQAVEDRICKKIDLTSRPDLNDLQVMAALRLLLKIVRRNGLAVDFSPSEIFLLRHGTQHNLRTEMTCWCQNSPRPDLRQVTKSGPKSRRFLRWRS